jgi:hypothetical protein
MGWLVLPKRAVETEAQACMDLILAKQAQGKSRYAGSAYCEIC